MKKYNTMPGHYEGFGEPVYPKTAVSSVYVESFDGTKIAVDIIRPADEDGKAVEARFPTLLLTSRAERYRGCKRRHNGVDIIDYCVPYGYVGAVLSVRGADVSYGTKDSFAGIEDRRDVNAVLDWIGQQSWSDGSAVMFGGSNRGFSQLTAAVSKPAPSPVLKGITPVVANADFYYQDFPNGVSAIPPAKAHAGLFGTPQTPKPKSKEEFLAGVNPVDEDTNGDMAYEAYLKDQFGKNHGFMNYLVLPDMCRDDENPNFGGEKTNLTVPPQTDLPVFLKSGIKIHQFAGEIESGTFGQLVASKEWGGSLLMGPWDHHESRTGTKNFPEGEFDFKAEHHKWFDYLLKGKDNSFAEQPRYAYYTINAKSGQNWRFSDSWPLETERRMKLYLSPKQSGTVSSVNDGSLSLQKPEEVSASNYKVDTSIQVFDEGEGASIDRMHLWWDGDMVPGVDSKGLTFTSAPIFHMRENEIAGAVSVELWVSSTQKDGDFIAYLEEVLPDGRSRYLEQGVQRASHRTTAPRASWNEMGAYYHPCLRADMERCLEEGMDEPVLLQFHIEPISYVLNKKSRLRLTITCSDSLSYQSNMYDREKLPTIRLYQGGDKASFISVPWVEHEENTYNGRLEWGDYQGPATMYCFKEHSYLYYNGRWKKFAAKDFHYVIEDGVAVFDAGFRFIQEGDPIQDGIMQYYEGGEKPIAPFPAFRHVYVDTVPFDKSIEETLYTPGVKTLLVNVYAKNSAEKNRPAIAYVHGYGGSIGRLQKQQADLIDRGYVLVAIDLRSYPGNFYPDHVKDLKGAIRMLRARAEEFGIDPNRIGALGQSLGGNGGLCLGVMGGEEELEGNVGGNLEYSSRVQAICVGYAWSDSLYMGKDLYEEYAAAPQELREKKQANSDGPNAPLAHVIGFSGPGRGMKVLREYAESGREGSDPELDQWLQKARAASPISHVAPDSCPMALYGGLGMTRVDIPNEQSNRTFRACDRYGIEAYLFANTMGEYGKKPLIAKAIVSFFDEILRDARYAKKTVAKLGSCTVMENYIDRKLEYALFMERDGKILIAAPYLLSYYGYQAKDTAEIDGCAYVDPAELTETEIGFEWYTDKQMAVLRPRKDVKIYQVKDRTS